MEKKNPMTFTLGIVAIILGVALHKQFDYTTFSFEKPALAAVYLVVFAAAVVILVKGRMNKPKPEAEVE